MSTVTLSIPEQTLRRVAADAERLNVGPEVIAETALETVFGPTSLEIAQEIDADPQLRAMIERSEADIRAGRVHSNQKVMEWRRDHPE